MEVHQQPCIPLPLDNKEQLKELVEKAKDWALLHGLGMRSKAHFTCDSITFAPFLLFPSTFPASEFPKAYKIQPILNELMHRVAHDNEFLRNALSETIKTDAFTARLVQIHQQVLNEGVAQEVCMGLFRSDYMVDSPSGTIKQVEFNTIASSFGALTTILPEWHKYALSLMGYEEKAKQVPPSYTLKGYADAFRHAYALYNATPKTAAILFVVEDISFNIGDQRLLEFCIQEVAPQVRIIRRTLTEIGTQLTIGDEKQLYINGVEIAVVYYRSGYAPEFYHTELEWNARLQIERSRAIKCPPIHYHLAGSKKIQQELARPGVLEKFLNDPGKVEAVREVFTGLYSLDISDATANETITLAIENPANFVLKPQREGGGNNLYDEDISKHLTKIQDSEERHGWILMDKIHPPLLKSYIVRPGHEDPIFTDTVSELGVFGVIIGTSVKISLNTGVGHMLRSKASSSNEGGVAIGLGALDSVYLHARDD